MPKQEQKQQQEMVEIPLIQYFSSLDLIIKHFKGAIEDVREFTQKVDLELALDAFARDPANYSPIIAINCAFCLRKGQVFTLN